MEMTALALGCLDMAARAVKGYNGQPFKAPN